MKEKTVFINKTAEIDEDVFYSCTLAKKHTIKSFILETIDTARHVSYRIRGKRKEEVCIDCYHSTNGKKTIRHRMYCDVYMNIKKAEAIEINGQYCFTLYI